MSKEKQENIIKGRVVSAKTPQTVTVLVERVKVHPFYGKTFARSKKYLVHDEKGASLGDIVEISKIRPVSKKKHFKVVKIVGKDMEALISKQLKEKAAAEIAEVMPEKEDREEEQVLSIKEEKEENIKKETKKSRKKKGEK